MTELTNKERALKLAAMRGISLQNAEVSGTSGSKFDLTAELAKNNIIIEGNVLEILEKNPTSLVYIERRADGKYVIAPPKNL